MRRSVPLLVLASLLKMPAVTAAAPIAAVKPPHSQQRLLESLEKLSGATTRADIRRLVAVQMQLERQVPAAELAPRFVPLLFHPAGRVRQIADQVVRRSGPGGYAVAVEAFRSRFRSSNIEVEVKDLLRKVDRTDRVVPAMLDRIYRNHRESSRSTRLAILRTLIFRNNRTPAAQRIYRAALLDGEFNARKYRLHRLRVLAIVVPTKAVVDRVLLSLLDSKDERNAAYALRALGRYPHPSRKLINAISRRLSHPSKLMFAAALGALTGCAKWSDVRPTFQTLSRSNDPVLRRRALKLLIAFNPDTATTVRAVSSALPFEKDDATRLHLVKELARIAPEKAATIRTMAATVADDGNRQVRIAALESLAAIGTKAKSVGKQLTAVLEKETDDRIRLKTVRTLQHIYPRDSKVQLVLRKIEGELIFARATKAIESILRKQKNLLQDTRRLNVESILGDVKTRK